MNSPALKQKKCRHCKEYFTPWNSLHVACSTKCAIQITQAAKEKSERQRLKRDRERIKTKGELAAEAQKAFNSFIRERDRDEPCISCGQTNPGGDPRGGVWDCSHYRSVGACPELRFDELNAHKGCKNCNRDKSGNIVEYRIRLIERIGQWAVDWIEGPHDPKHYSKDDLREIKRHYQQKKRELLNAPSQNPPDR